MKNRRMISRPAAFESLDGDAFEHLSNMIQQLTEQTTQQFETIQEQTLKNVALNKF